MTPAVTPQPSNAILKCRPLGLALVAGSLRSCASVASKSEPTCAGRCSGQGVHWANAAGPMQGGPWCMQADQYRRANGSVGHCRRNSEGQAYLRRDWSDGVGRPLPVDGQRERRLQLAERRRCNCPRRGASSGGRLPRRATRRATRRARRRARAWEAAVYVHGCDALGRARAASPQVWEGTVRTNTEPPQKSMPPTRPKSTTTPPSTVAGVANRHTKKYTARAASHADDPRESSVSPRLQTIAAGRRFGDLPPPESRRAWRS